MSMNSILNNLKASGVNTEGLENIIITDALIAAGAAAVGGVVPVLAIPSMIVSGVGAIWHMYIKLAARLGVSWGNGMLKTFASAAVTNMAANLAGLLAGEVLAVLIPGASVLVGAALTYYIIYVAGMMFLTMLAKLLHRYGSMEAVPDTIDSDEIRCDKSYFKDAMKDAKSSFSSHKSKM